MRYILTRDEPTVMEDALKVLCRLACTFGILRLRRQQLVPNCRSKGILRSHGGHVGVANNSEKSPFGNLILLLCKT